MDVYENLKALAITLPSPPPKGGIYSPVQKFGDHFLYCSGCGPQIDPHPIIGKLGESLTLEEGQRAAYCCILNLLANLNQALGDLNRIKRFVKILVFVNCSDSFTEQPKVANGGSSLLLSLFGEERGCPARTAVGVNTLPGGIACEIEALVEFE